MSRDDEVPPPEITHRPRPHRDGADHSVCGHKHLSTFASLRSPCGQPAAGYLASLGSTSPPLHSHLSPLPSPLPRIHDSPGLSAKSE